MCPVILAFISLLLVTQPTLANRGPTECHDPAITGWMLNSHGRNPCLVVQDVMRVCNPSFNISWLTPSYSCDNSPSSISAACCCGSPTFALYSACWSCQYNYTMDIVSTTFTSFEKRCASVPTPLTTYEPTIKPLVEQLDIPLWAKMEPSAGRWDLVAAWRNATPSTTSTTAPVPTSYPQPQPQTNTLSSGAIVGIIVGSVFGTSVMFLLAAFILWRCLGLGRYRFRQRDNDIRVGQNMGYLGGEYIYVRPASWQDASPNGGLRPRRYTLRDPRYLSPREIDASDYEVSPGPSDNDNDTLSRPLRAYSRSEHRSSYLGARLSYVEPPSPYSIAHHASFDGQYRGYHPGTSPGSTFRPSLEEPRPDGLYRASRDRGDYDVEFRASGDHSRRPISGHFSQRRLSGDHLSPSARNSLERYNPHASAPSRDRPLSGHFVDRRPISGQFVMRPISGHFSEHRTSVERRQEHRLSIRHGSFDSTRRSGEGRLTRLEEIRRSRDGGRFSRDEVRFSRDDRDLYRKASLSEGAEDRERQEEESIEEVEEPRGSEATGSQVAHAGHQQHLRKRSQSARASRDWGHDDMVVEEQHDSRADHPATIPSTSNSQSAPSKHPRALRITNPQSDSDSQPSPGPSSRRTPVTREPGLLARARGLLSARSSRSSASGHRNQESPTAPPPSAWQQRLSSVLRSRSGSLLSSRPESAASHVSDATSYHTAHGHPSGSGTPVTELGHRSRPSAQVSDETSYQQEVDAGVQLVLENSPDRASENHSSPPAYTDPHPAPSTLRPDPAARADDPVRMSTLAQDTALSGDPDADSTVSSGVLQTWAAARRPTGFVGTGRIVQGAHSPRSSQDAGTSLQDSSTAVSTSDEGHDGGDEADKPMPPPLTRDSHKSGDSRGTATEAERV